MHPEDWFKTRSSNDIFCSYFPLVSINKQYHVGTAVTYLQTSSSVFASQ